MSINNLIVKIKENGWIQSKEEVKSELGLNDDEISKMWNKNLKLCY